MYPIFSWAIWFFNVQFYFQFFIYFGYQFFIRCVVGKIFSLSVGCCFVQMMVSFILEKLCSFVTFYLLNFDLTVVLSVFC